MNELKLEMDLKLQKIHSETEQKLMAGPPFFIQSHLSAVRLQMCRRLVYKQQSEKLDKNKVGFNNRLKKLLDDNLVELQNFCKQYERTVNSIYGQHFNSLQ